jgi:hypothetical protein
MFVLLSKVLVAMLALGAGTYFLLSILCRLTDHDGLVMLHMYSTPLILAAALGAILLITRNRPATSGGPGTNAP